MPSYKLLTLLEMASSVDQCIEAFQQALLELKLSVQRVDKVYMDISYLDELKPFYISIMFTPVCFGSYMNNTPYSLSKEYSIIEQVWLLSELTYDRLRQCSDYKKYMASLFNLTNRECEVLRELSKGIKYMEIAKNLGIRPSTVKENAEKIKEKMRVKKIEEEADKKIIPIESAVAKAIWYGVI